MAVAGRTHDFTINTVGGSNVGFMRYRDRSGRRGGAIRDSQTIAPRMLTQDQITQAQLPPDIQLIFTQDDWRGGMGGILYRKHPEFLANTTTMDNTESGVLKLARVNTATTVDSNPDEYVPSGFAVSGTQLWAFMGRDAYSWDFTNKNWDIQTEPVAAARTYRNGLNFSGTMYAPAWADDVGSGGSYVVADEPTTYLYKTPSAAQWSVVTNAAQALDACKFLAIAGQNLWGGYWSEAVDSGQDTGAPAVDATSQTNYATGPTTMTRSHVTSTGGSRGLIVGVVMRDSGGAPAVPDSATYNGVSMTQERTQTQGNVRVTAFSLINPASGTNNIVVSNPATTDGPSSIRGITFTAANQSDLIRAHQGVGLGARTSGSFGLTTVVGEIAVDVVGWSADVTSVAEGGGQTDIGTSSVYGGASYEVATGTTTTMEWTWTNSVALAWIQLALAGGLGTTGNVITDGTPSDDFTAGDVIRIDSELMLVTTVTDGTKTLTVVRGYRGTAAATHDADSNIYIVTEQPHQVRSTSDGTALGNWSTATSVGDSSAPITSLLGVGNDLIVIKTDGIYRLEPDGTVTNLRPELTAFGHEDFGKASWVWNDTIFIPLHGGGLWELETRSWTVRDISFSMSMPEQSEYHGRVVAGNGEPNRLYVMVLEAGSTKYHVLMTENPAQTGIGDYNWCHVGSVGYTTGTDANHAALLLEAVTSGSAEHHRLLVGVESTGSNLFPYYIPHDVHDDEHEYSASNGEAYTVAFDGGFPNVAKRAQSITCNTDNLGAAGGSNNNIHVLYRLDGTGDWLYVNSGTTSNTGNNSTLISDNQTIAFASTVTFKKIELRFTFDRRSSGNETTPELHDFTMTSQLRPDTVKLLPVSVYIANGQRRLNGGWENQAKANRDQLRTWNAQAAEVQYKENEQGTTNTRTCVFLPGTMVEQEVSSGIGRFPELRVDFTLAEVG